MDHNAFSPERIIKCRLQNSPVEVGYVSRSEMRKFHKELVEHGFAEEISEEDYPDRRRVKGSSLYRIGHTIWFSAMDKHGVVEAEYCPGMYIEAKDTIISFSI